MREWLAADADGRDVKDRGLGEGIACDPAGCVAKLGDGRLVSYVLTADAFADDCQRVAVIVATRAAPPDCAATVIGRSLRRERGAPTLRRDGAGFVIDSARPPSFDRPWSPRLPRQTAAANSEATVNPPEPAGSPPRDATPQSEDLQADD
jgi:competence protein ComEC